MAYAKIRVREISSGEIGATDIHNSRLYDEHPDVKVPENLLDENGNRRDSSNNTYTYFAKNEEGYRKSNTEINLKQAIDSRIKDAGCKVKSNSVLALEFVCSMDPELTANMKDPELYLNYCRAWLEEQYGFDNIVATTIHREELEPHIHVIVTPIKQKKVKWKNAKGEGERIENRLCARDFTGEKPLLEKMQDDFHAFTKNFGSKFGVEFYRGLKASEQLKVYTKKTDHTIGLLRKEMNEVKEKSRALGLELRTDIYDYNQMVDLLSKKTDKAIDEFEEAHKKNEEIRKIMMEYVNEAYEISGKIQTQERLLKEEQSKVAAQEQKRQRVNTSLDENGIARWKKGEENFHGDKPKKKEFKR